MPGSNSEGELLSTILGSGTAGFFSRIPTHPIDTAKSKTQVQSALVQFGQIPEKVDPAHSNIRWLRNIKSEGFGKIIVGANPHERWEKPFRNVVDAVMKIFRREGLVGLYRGFFITGFGSVPAVSIYLTTFEAARNRVKGSRFAGYELFTDFWCGILAEAMSCTLFVPIDVIKERLQVQSLAPAESRYRGSIDAIVKISNREGVRGLYRAYGATVASFGPYSGLYLALYQHQRQSWKDYLAINEDKDLPARVFIISSLISAGIASWVTNPLDLAKLRMQVNRGPMGFNFPYKHMGDGLVKIFRDEGVTGLWRGAGARMLFFSLNTSLTISVFEVCRIWWKQTLYDS